MTIKIIFAPSVDDAILNHLDYMDVSDIPQALHSINEAQKRLAKTLSTFPLGGAKFQNDTYYFTVGGYVFIYEFDANTGSVNVLDLHMSGKNWINR